MWLSAARERNLPLVSSKAAVAFWPAPEPFLTVLEPALFLAAPAPPFDERPLFLLAASRAA